MPRDLTFYSTAAQVLPVLFLALVLETVRSGAKPVRTSLFIVCIAGLIGEAVAFEVLANASPEGWKAIVVAESLWVAGWALIMRILLQALELIATDEGERDDTNLVAVLGIGVLSIGVLLIPWL